MRPAMIAFALSPSRNNASAHSQTSRDRGTHVFEAKIVACVF